MSDSTTAAAMLAPRAGASALAESPEACEDVPPPAPRSVLVRPGEGEVMHAFGDTIELKLGPQQTGGRFSIGLGTIPPGAGPPPHRHLHEEEVFLVLDGRYQFFCNGEWKDAGPGDVFYTPPAVVHTFKNVGDTVGHAWIMATPCGFEHFFAECAAVFAAAGAGAPPDMAKIVEISTAHGIEYVPPLGGVPGD